jgi:hypothetical protein
MSSRKEVALPRRCWTRTWGEKVDVGELRLRRLAPKVFHANTYVQFAEVGLARRLGET